MRNIFHWSSEFGLVVNIDPTAANVIIDLLFIALAAYISTAAAKGLVILRRIAVAQGKKEILPLGRIGVIEVAKEWMALRTGKCNHCLYAAVLGVAVLLAVARSLGDLGILLKKYELGDARPGRLYNLTSLRPDIVFDRNAGFRGTQQIHTEFQYLPSSEIDDLNLYDRALRLAVEFYDVADDSAPAGSTEYSVKHLSVKNDDPKPIGGPAIRLRWREATWLKENMSNLIVNVTVGPKSNKTIQFYRHEYEIKANLLGEQGFDDLDSCFVESLGSSLKGLTILFMGCRKVRTSQIHSYIGFLAACAEKFVDGHWMYSSCFHIPNIGLVTEFEESVTEGSLSPMPMPVLGSFTAIAAVGREPGRTNLATSMRVFLACRLYCASWEDVSVREEVIRAELRYPFLAVIGLQIILAITITVCVPVCYRHAVKLDEFVGHAHIPSHGYEWALKARNEKLYEWPSARPKPKHQKVRSSFGIVHLNGECDHLGITAEPHPGRGKPLGSKSGFGD